MPRVDAGNGVTGDCQGRARGRAHLPGRLTEAGLPANGLHDFQVCLFDAPGNPVALDCAPDFNEVQARIAANCPEGGYLRGINADGSVVCESVVAYLGIKLFAVVDESPGGNAGQWPRIAIGADGLPVISYLDGAASDLKVAKCASADGTGAATITTLSRNIQAMKPDLAIGSDGLPVIDYCAGG